MRHALAAALLALTIGLASATASAASPPPGATAHCTDGSYSFSTHHSGSCSHHGGVAAWLDGSSSTGTGGSASKSGTTLSPAINVGTTVLPRKRTKTSGCTLAALPDLHCSPGSYYSKLTKRVICSSTFRTGSVRNVPDSEKHAVEVEYGLAPKGYGRTLEIDHIVSLELGGSNDIANLYPEEAKFADGSPGYHVKDRLENKVHDLVCSGAMTLRAAQRSIASNWENLYKRVFGSAP